MMELKNRKVIIGAVGSILVIASILAAVSLSGGDDEVVEITISDILNSTSVRRGSDVPIIAPEEEPFLALAATPVACWYDIGASGENAYGLRPLMISSGGLLDDPQNRFLENAGYSGVQWIGALTSGSGQNTLLGEITIGLALDTYQTAAGALVITDEQEQYELAVVAAPMTSYLNIPLIVKDDRMGWSKLSSALEELDADYLIALGDASGSIASNLGGRTILLEDRLEVQDAVMQIVKARFGRLDHVTLTNPEDIVGPDVLNSETETFTREVNNLRIETGALGGDIVGESTHHFTFSVPEGIIDIGASINFTRVEASFLDPLKEPIEVEPVIYATLRDGEGRLAAYAPSFSFELGKDYLETLVIDSPGTYDLEVNVFYGIDGFNTYAGTELSLSRIDADYEVSVRKDSLGSPHRPMYRDLSMMGPYLAASHGGIVLADPSFEMTSEDYREAASGLSTGPSYDTSIHEHIDQRVMENVAVLQSTIERMKDFDLHDDYINGPAWLAILGGPNMIPQYYEPKEASWVEDPIYGVGWPTDVPYSLDLQLSTARVLGEDVGDVSALICRTLFYEDYTEGHTRMIKEQYGSDEEWGANFHFLAGEMGGRTGWFFWQREFSSEVEEHGFHSEEYLQNYENDRQTMEYLGAYERANFLDLMMHGNWYWYVPELNGLDSYSTGVKNSDLRKSPDEWELGPSVVVTGSCILGRIDNVPPFESMTMTFFHAGVNAFFGATRSTGSEAKAGTVERTLLYEDVSIGEALRADKKENTEPAAYWVRNLFGDPAFNPFEPENGYSDQGRPVIIVEQAT